MTSADYWSDKAIRKRMIASAEARLPVSRRIPPPRPLTPEEVIDKHPAADAPEYAGDVSAASYLVALTHSCSALNCSRYCSQPAESCISATHVVCGCRVMAV